MITCYATPGKVKAVRLCELFAQGVNAAGGQAKLSAGIPRSLQYGAAAFYGVTPETRHLWRQAIAEGRDWYYIDNSYFDAVRGTEYRITRNRLQHRGCGSSDGRRFESLGIRIEPWREGRGDYLLICEQSPQFMQTVAGLFPAEWQKQVQQIVASYPDMPVRVRTWQANKIVAAQTLGADLKHAAAVITWGSAAAIEALIRGITVHVAPPCAAYGVAPPFRTAWAHVLADNQWTLAEIGDGTAWRALNGGT